MAWAGVAEAMEAKATEEAVKMAKKKAEEKIKEKKEKAEAKKKAKEKKEEEPSEQAPPSGEQPPSSEGQQPPSGEQQKGPGRARRAFEWLKGKAPAAGTAAKGAAIGGAVLGGAAVGAGLAGGGAAYRGGKGLVGGAWRLSQALFAAINILFFSSLLFHWYDAGTDFGQFTTRGLILIFFAIYAWLFIYSKYESGIGDIKAIIPPLMISAIAIILPVILLNAWVIRVTHLKEIFTAVLVFAPIWPIVIMFGMPSTRIIKIARVIYIIFIIIAFVPSAWYAISADLNVQTMSVGASRYFYEAGKAFVTGWKYSYTAVKALPSKIKKTAQQQIQYAVGDYYTGEVEDGKNKPVGVYIENLEPVATEFNADDTIVVWATLIARTLDPDKQVDVTATCWGEKMVGDELKKVQGDADPSSDRKEFIMTTTTEEERYITCEFPPLFFDKGPKSVFVNANFNFETMSYLKAYFMNLETLRAMKRSNIDPFDQYKIKDKSPQSVCTNGPISLNMKTSESPIGVSTTEQTDIKLGITMENMWKGRIKRVNDLMIKIPPGMEVTYCDHSFEKVACAEDECEDGKYLFVYKIKKQKTTGRLGLDDIKNVEGYHSIACRLKVDDMNRFMGSYPLISSYFKTTADYEYELEQSTMVDVKEAVGGGAGGVSVQTQQQRQPTFTYTPSSSSVTVKVGQKKEFLVAITNPGAITYGWRSEGVKEETMPDATSYIFSSDTAGSAKVTFIAESQNKTMIEERSWDVEVVEATT